MARLVPVPEGAAIELDPARPLRLEGADAGALCVLVAERRHWVLFDVSGRVRVDARAVRGGATTLDDGALIRGGTRRLRFCADGAAAPESGPHACGFCRDAVELDAAACIACGRAHHAACLALARRCGRCGVAQ